MRISFLEPATDELEEAISHYEQQKEGLGGEFAEEIARTLTRILHHPNTWAKLSENIHCCRAKRFPYAVLYSVREDEIVVVAVMHLHRKPGYWIDRTQP